MDASSLLRRSMSSHLIPWYNKLISRCHVNGAQAALAQGLCLAKVWSAVRPGFAEPRTSRPMAKLWAGHPHVSQKTWRGSTGVWACAGCSQALWRIWAEPTPARFALGSAWLALQHFEGDRRTDNDSRGPVVAATVLEVT